MLMTATLLQSKSEMGMKDRIVSSERVLSVRDCYACLRRFQEIAHGHVTGYVHYKGGRRKVFEKHNNSIIINVKHVKSVPSV